MSSKLLCSADAALRTIIRNSIAAAFPMVTSIPEILLTASKFADYQCNNAMQLSRTLAQLSTPIRLDPKQVGEQIVKQLPLGPTDVLEGASVTDKGFINLTLGTSWLSRQVEVLSVARGPLRREAPSVPPQRVLVDFSSPNIAKEMHVGHLRSTIIGESVCRLLEYLGHTVARINHVGDWGTQFGMLILFLKEQYPNFLEAAPPINDLQAFYRAAKEKFDTDPVFADKARAEVVALQALKEDSIAAWKNICDVSRREFQQIYDRLGVRVDERGESFYNPLIPQVLQILQDAGKLRQSEGATIISSVTSKPIRQIDAKELSRIISAYFVSTPKGGGTVIAAALLEALRAVGALSEDDVLTLGKRSVALSKIDTAKDLTALATALLPLFTADVLHPAVASHLRAFEALRDDGVVDVPMFSFPLIVRKSDGGYTYDTTDVTAMYHRYVMDKQDRVVYVTDVGQFEHFRMCAQVALEMKWMPQEEAWTHAGFGLVSGTDGKKFKTRSGDTVRLRDLLDEAGDRCFATMQEREKGDRGQGYSEEYMMQLSRRIGYAAVRYQDLKQNRTSDYTFSYDKMLDLNGNTAVFLLYAYARICGILRKASEGLDTPIESTPPATVTLQSPKERTLALCLVRFDEVILRSADDLYLHKIADYVYDIACRLGEFYSDCRVLGSEQQDSRITLLRAVANTIFAALHLLGIEPLERI